MADTLQTDLFTRSAISPRLVPGFSYAPGFLTAAEETALVAEIETLPLMPFEFHGYLGSRRIVSYGFRYDYARNRLEKSAPIPRFLEGLRDRAAAFLAVDPRIIVQSLVTEYTKGAGIGWHRDKPEFDDVVAFSLLAPCRLRLRRKVDGAWEHSIPPMDRLRYSVTFRTLRAAPPSTGR